MVQKCGPCERISFNDLGELACGCCCCSFLCFMFVGIIWVIFMCKMTPNVAQCPKGQVCHSYEPDNHHPNLHPYFVACQAACAEEYQCCNVEVSQGMNGKPSCLQACYESLIRLDENLNVSESACLDSCTPQSVYYFVHGGVEIHTDSMCADVPGNHYCESNPAPYDCAAADGVDEFSCVTGCKVAQELKDSF